MFEFILNNWSSLLLILVGSFALLVYWLQERRKETDAASLILVQIDEIQDRIKEIQSYIVDNQLNEIAFYESQALFAEDYWNHYKHYFIRKMDTKSYRSINLLYSCASEIQEQQQLMKNLQKNFFFIKQQVLANLETNYVLNGLNNNSSNPVDINQVIAGIMSSMSSDMTLEQKNAIENMLIRFCNTNEHFDTSVFWQTYNQKRAEIISIMNQNVLTVFIPDQIRRSLQKSICQYSLLEVVGSDGYKKLQTIAKRRV